MSFSQRAKLSRSTSERSGSQSTELKSYQKECVKFGLQRPAAGFFLAPGLGKTLISLYIFKILRKLGIVDHLFVLAGRRIIYGVWRQEVKKWGFPFRVTRLHGKNKNARLKSDVDVYLMNYEGLNWLVSRGRGGTLTMTREARNFFKTHPRIMLVVDESSKLRNSSTKRFRSLKKLLPKFLRRYILTGSPAPKGLINLFGQVYVLDMGESLGSSLTAYRNSYFIPTGFMGYQFEPQEDAEERIFKKLRPLVRRYGTDQLDLPPITTVDRWVELPTTARRLYKEVEKEFVSKWKRHEIVAANAAVASGKCRQIANGGLFVADRQWKSVHDEKCANLLELLEELQGEPALVAFEFKHDRLRAQRYFADQGSAFADAPYIAGGTSDRAAAKVQRAWDRGYLPLLWGHPDSVAHGLNLQGKGGIVIYFSMTWSLENYEQFYQRVWRQGQRKRVIIYRILARDTIDEVMTENVASRDKTQQRILNAMEKRYGALDLAPDEWAPRVGTRRRH